jgi:hypothetical protein
MFEMSDQFSSKSSDEAYDNNRLLNIDQVIPQRADTINQKIFLPRGSGQSRFEPQPYYYLASQSGAMPSWIIDELQYRSPGRHLNS